ncbi:MAG TPA: N(G),N(G)-dimethylarginine dimethylaminohydrolase [Pseudomonadota bacterium]|nr:N(G),N(G)-dimethylarginine dimethylaminohydrolase [Pseudomonadota bacterium]
MHRFRHALVRPPGANFAAGLSSSGLGAPDLALALRQHARYCAALQGCGLEVHVLPADETHPDATFVEDTAILTAAGALLTRPGAATRRGEVAAIGVALATLVRVTGSVTAPGTVDGGDVCECDQAVYIGISARSNAEGADQLETWLAPQGLPLRRIDIRPIRGLLHLKTGMSSLGDGRVAALAAFAPTLAATGLDVVPVDEDESYAANCVRVNDHVLVAAGYPRFEARLVALGYRPLALEMSEFRRMDGGLSCLSLRW